MTDTTAAVAAAAEQAAGHAEQAKKLFPPLDPAVFIPQWIWLAITFSALYFLLSRIVLPKIGAVIQDRRNRIQADLDAAAKLKAETDAALAAYEKSLSDARANASATARQAREKLAAETDAEKTKVESALTAKIGEAETRIQATKAKALSSVGDIATDTAGSIIEKLLGTKVSADDIKRAMAPGAGE
jgi:F-type H+-transporting ATPase subunit b